MSAFDDDPEYEAQLKEVLGDEAFPSLQDNGDEEMGDFEGPTRQDDEQSEDGVLDNAPSFRMKMPGNSDNMDTANQLSVAGEENGPALSEDARSISTGDDSPSVQGSEMTLSAPATPSKMNGYEYLSPIRAFSPSRRFDIREHRRLSSYSSLPSPSPSPSPLHSRMSSYSSNVADVADIPPSDSPQVPWEVVRWTKLRKVGGQAFSVIGRQKFGNPTVLASSGVIAIGTSKGLVLIFDFRQSLKHVIGVGTKAAESGAVTALALSADHSTLLCGHASGEIFTWDLSKPAQPHSHTSTLSAEQISTSRRDGHLSGSAILHVDFLGLRHGAFVTADEIGMAFVHTISRKMVVASVTTTRILGRYPERVGSARRPINPHKPSCVLGMGSLPLGSVKYVTDEMQLVGLLSPYKLVIVSILPFPQTQLRVARPKRASPEGSILLGCMAWYPCVKPDQNSSSFTKPILAYSWDRYLAIREVVEIPQDTKDGKEGPPKLQFTMIKEWTGEETIVAMRWLLHHVLVLLTVSQRLLILDTTTMQVTASSDLLMKQILHYDRFSSHMNNFPAIADAYYHSFHTYKQKIFLLCAEEISVGSLLTWADRVLALVEAADFIEAINLTTSYYLGKSAKITLGLPEDDEARHAAVQDKLTELVTASLKWTFLHKDETPGTDYVHAEVAHQKMVKDLTARCIEACVSIDAISFLFDEVYEIFEEHERLDVFVDTLEPYILDNQITDVPPVIVKDITSHFVGRDQHQRLEQIICHINPASLDIDQITSMCRQHGLYDAFAYVYNNALNDYVTPLVEFIDLIRDFLAKPFQLPHSAELIDHEKTDITSSAFLPYKAFPYLSYILTGRVYPTGEDLSDDEAYEAKQSIYSFLFSGRNLSWPRNRGPLIRTTSSEDVLEPTFPYLRLLLRFDAPTFFQAMDEAFEDRFLNGADTATTNGNSDSFSRAINRQFIINIFFEVMAPPRSSDIIYLYMFIARNLPKYPQFILLNDTRIESIILELCAYGAGEMAEEAQLAVEYLLSVYKPSDPEKMIQAYQDAHFYRILKHTLRAEGRYTELLDIYLRDEEQTEVFDCADGLLRGGSILTAKQREAVIGFLVQHIQDLVNIDVPRTATTFERFVPERQPDMVEQLKDDDEILFTYLDTIISNEQMVESATWIDVNVRELYIAKLCQFRPSEVTTFLDSMAIDKVRVEKILPVLERYRIIDAVILLLRRAGMIKEAMNKLVIHISNLHRDIVTMIQYGGRIDDVDLLVAEIGKYASVGADLCETFSKETKVVTNPIKKSKRKELVLNDAEQMWLSLLETVVTVTRTITTAITDNNGKVNGEVPHPSPILNSLRVVVQNLFTRLLTLTSSTPSSAHLSANLSARRASSIHVSFLSILRQFLQNLASTPLTDLRSILSSIFDAYRYERQLIEVTSKLVEADLFQDFLRAKHERERGWRPLSNNCMACGRIMFGPGAKGKIFSKWEQRRLEAAERKMARDESRREYVLSLTAAPEGKGKGKSVDIRPSEDDTVLNQDTAEDIEGDIVVFGCGHAYHRQCLTELTGKVVQDEGVLGEGDGNLEARFRCIVCESQVA